MTSKDRSSSDSTSSGIKLIEPQMIDANPLQPRTVFQEKLLEELAVSIRQDGVLQPVIVSSHPKFPDRYQLIAGERRLRASKIAGLQRIPAVIKSVSGEDRLRLALIENIQRSELNIVEEGKAYRTLIQEYGLTQDECAKKVGKDRSSIANAIRILSLPKFVHDDLCEEVYQMGHARALLSLKDSKHTKKARDIVVRKGLSVRKAELLCKQFNDEGNNTGAQDSDIDPDVEYVANNLRSYLRTKVKISGSSQRGKIEISYFSAAELERVLGLVHSE